MPIRPTFYGFEMARTALSASQKNIDITGQNIANINTPGYSRQRVNLSSVGPGGINWRFALHPAEMVGLGVNVDSIRRVRDQFLDMRFRREFSENSRLAVKLDVLGYVESNIDEFIGESGTLHSIVVDFQNAFQNLHLNADDVEFMTMTRSAAEKLVYTSRTIAGRIQEITEHTYEQLDIIKKDINRIAQALGDVNKEIRNQFLLGGVSNELLDERDLLLDQLSAYGDVTVRPAIIEFDGKEVDSGGLHVYFGKFDADAYDPDDPLGADSILVSGAIPIDVDDDGKPVYHYTLDFNFTLEDIADNTDNQVRLEWADGRGDFITTSGEIFGYYEMLNGKGDISQTGDNVDIASKGIPYFMEMINAFVQELASVFNDINYLPLFTASDGGDMTALNITIVDEWQKDPTYILRSIDDGSPGAARNDNILRMIDALKAERTFIDANGNEYTGNFLQYLGSINSEMGLEVSYNAKRKDVSDINLLSVDMYRASIMDVDSDEEAMNLMKFQKSYNAAARFMTTLDEMLDVIVNRLGIVGR